MHLEPVKTAAQAVGRSVRVFGSYVMIKRCWRCRHLLGKRAMVCPYCHRWQA